MSDKKKNSLEKSRKKSALLTNNTDSERQDFQKNILLLQSQIKKQTSYTNTDLQHLNHLDETFQKIKDGVIQVKDFEKNQGQYTQMIIPLFKKIYTEILPNDFFQNEFKSFLNFYPKDIYVQVIEVGDMLIYLIKTLGQKIKKELRDGVITTMKVCLEQMKQKNESMVFNRKDSESDHYNEKDRAIMEQAFYSLIGICYILLATCSKKEQFSEVIKTLFIPLLQISLQYECTFFDSTQNFNSKRKIQNILAFNDQMFEQNTLKPIENYSLISLLLWIIQNPPETIYQHLQKSSMYKLSLVTLESKHMDSIIDLIIRKQIQFYLIKKKVPMTQVDEIQEQKVKKEEGKTIENIDKEEKEEEKDDFQLVDELQNEQTFGNLRQNTYIESVREMKVTQIISINDIPPSNDNSKKMSSISNELKVSPMQLKKYSLSPIQTRSSANEQRLSYNKDNVLQQQIMLSPAVFVQQVKDGGASFSPSILIKNEKDSQFHQRRSNSASKNQDSSAKKSEQQFVTFSKKLQEEEEKQIRSNVMRISEQQRIINELGRDDSQRSAQEEDERKQVQNQNERNSQQQKEQNQIYRQNAIYLMNGAIKVINDIEISHLLKNSGKLEYDLQVQKNWIRVSAQLIEVSHDILDKFFCFDVDQDKYSSLWHRTFDLFKISLYFLAEKKIYTDFSNSKSRNMFDIRDIPDTPMYACNMSFIFHTLFKIQKIRTNKLLLESFQSDYISLLDTISNGGFDKIDTLQYIKIYYLLFFNTLQINGKEQEELIRQNMPNIFKIFNQFFYYQKYIKEFETAFLNSEEYSKIAGKLKGISENKNEYQEMNLALVQQLMIDLIQNAVKRSNYISEAFWKQFNEVVTCNQSLLVNQSKLYQYLKLAIVVLNEKFISSSEIYDILGEEDKSIFLKYKTWEQNIISQQFSQKQFWSHIIQTIFSYFLKNSSSLSQSQQTQNEQGGNLMSNNNNNNANLLNAANNQNMNLLRQLSEKKVVKNQQQFINEQTFNLFSRFFIYITQNKCMCLELVEIINKKLNEIVKEKQLKQAQNKQQMLYIMIALCRNVLFSQQEPKNTQMFLGFLYHSVRAYADILTPYKKDTETQQSSSKRMQKMQNQTVANNGYLLKAKETAELILSVLTNYFEQQLVLNENQIQTGKEFELFQMYYFYEEVLPQIKRAMIIEESCVDSFISIICKVYFFQKEEPQELNFLETPTNGITFQSSYQLNSKILEFLFGVIIDLIDNKHKKTASLLMKVILQFHQKIVYEQSIYLIKFAKSLNVKIIKQIKKILIFLRENDALNDFAKYFKDIMILTLQSFHNPQILREYLSFMREIFYYNQDMDQVDYQLAIDMLESYNSLLQSHRIQKEREQSDPIYIPDYYHFSNITKGLIQFDNFRFKESFTVCCLFKLNLAQIKEQFQSDHNLSLINMVLFGFMSKEEENNVAPQVIPIISTRNSLKIFDKEIPHKDQWHFMQVKFKKQKGQALGLIQGQNVKFKVFLYIDDLKNQIGEINMTFNKNYDYTLFQGCQLMNLQSINNYYRTSYVFQGQISLLFFYLKGSKNKDCDEKQAEALKKSLIDLIQRKQMVYIYQPQFNNVLERLGYQNLIKKSSKQEFETMNDINEKLIMKHREAIQHGYLAAVHQKKVFEQLMGFEGFKNLYPVFYRSLKSNLEILDKAMIWKLLFKILRTFMNIDPVHILKLQRRNQIIEVLKYLIKKAGKHQILIKELLNEIYNILKDIKVNSRNELLRGFYKEFFNEIVINLDICLSKCYDQNKKKSFLVLHELIEFFGIIFDKEKYKENQRIKEYLINVESYNNLLNLLKQISSPELISCGKKIGKIITEYIFYLQHKEGFTQILKQVQNPTRDMSKTYIRILLKIVYDVITHPQLSQFKSISDQISQTFNHQSYFQYLTQFTKKTDYSQEEEVILDRIIAQALQILLFLVQKKPIFFVQAKSFLLINNQSKNVNNQYAGEEEKQFIYKSIQNQLLLNKKLSLKTYISLMFAAFKTLDTNKRIQMKTDNLIIHVSKRFDSIVLSNPSEFDSQIFRVTLSCANLFNNETKLLFFNQFNTLIEKQIEQITEQFQYDDLISDQIPSLRSQFYQIMNDVVKTSYDDTGIIGYSEYIVSNIASYQFINSFDVNSSTLVESDRKGLQLVNKLLLLFDAQPDCQLRIFQRILNKLFEFNFDKSKIVEQPLKTKLNLKLIILLQFFEELYIRKSDFIMQQDCFLQILGKFLLLFEYAGLLYYDFPYRQLFDNIDRKTITNAADIVHAEKIKSFEVIFLEGGALRIFLYIILQSLNQLDLNKTKFGISMQMLRFLTLHECSSYLQMILQDFNINPLFQSRETLCVLEQPLKVVKKKEIQISSTTTAYEKTKQAMSSMQQSHSNQSMVSTPGFLAILLMGEIYELIQIALSKFKMLEEYAISQQEKELKQKQCTEQVISYLKFIYDISIITFIPDNKSAQEDMGLLFFVITDPQIKDDLFQNYEILKSLRKTKGICPIYLCTQVEKASQQIRESNAFQFCIDERSGSQECLLFQNQQLKDIRASYFTKEANTPASNVSQVLNKEEIKDQSDSNNNSQINLHIEENQLKSISYDDLQQELIQFMNTFFTSLEDFFAENMDPSELEQQEFVQSFIEQILKTEQCFKVMATFTIITSTRFVDIIGIINQTLDSKTKNIRNEIEKTVSSKTSSRKLPTDFSIQLGKMQSSTQEVQSNSNNNQKYFEQSAITPKKQRPKLLSSQQDDDTNKNYKANLSASSFESYLKIYQKNTKKTINYYYIKQLYKKEVKRMFEDDSSIWFDHLEQMKKDYSDLKEIYKQINIMKPKEQGGDQDAQKEERFLKSKNEYDYFIRQRRNMDRWGRMMMVRPNRKYKQTRFWQIQAYYIHDFLKNLFCLSFLEDIDFQDYVAMGGALNNENENEMNQSRIPGQSQQFKKVKETVIKKIEQNGFLYELFTNPAKVLNTNLNEQAYNEKQVDFLEKEEKATFYAQYITVQGAYYGKIYLTNKYLMFQSTCIKIDSKFKFALHCDQDQRLEKKIKIWKLSELEEVFKRRFLLIHQAVEVYTNSKKCYFFNFLYEEKCKEFLDKLDEFKSKRNYKFELIFNARQRFEKLKLRQEWEEGEISNQEFLMLVNKYSGRSFNDMRQYPIFPWICNVYNVDHKQLSEKIQKKEAFRDLTRNAGILSESKRIIAKNTYKEDRDDCFQYGKEKFYLKFGFSNILSCLRMLNRIEPFTTSFLLGNSQIDDPNRTFNSLNGMWKNLNKEKQSNDELTPEFFYFPEMFKNHNLNNFGIKNSGYSVNEVKLPKWAKNEHDFIRIHREMLETEYIHQKMKSWLDMIFGVRQEDIPRKTIFFCFAYEKYWSVKENRESPDVESAIRSISEFMQVPQQIFTTPLDKEKRNYESSEEENDEEDNELMFGGGGGDPFSQNQGGNVMTSKQNYGLQQQTPQSVSQQSTPQNQQNTFGKLLDQSDQDLKVTSVIKHFLESKSKKQLMLDKIAEFHTITQKQIMHMIFTQNGKCLVFEQLPVNGQIQVYLCRETFAKTDLKCNFSLNLKTEYLRGDISCIFQEKSDKGGKNLLYVAQNLDNSFKIYEFCKKKNMNLIYSDTSHKNIVTAIKFSKDYTYLITGDADGEIHHYKNIDEIKQEKNKNDVIYQSNKNFPYILKHVVQDQMNTILSIDVNLVLDLFVSASYDGTIAVRCLRTCELWKVIHNQKLQNKKIQVVSLKLSLHGYIILILKTKDFNSEFYVYSLNGELLKQEIMDKVEIKQVFLYQKENLLILAQNVRKNSNQIVGNVRIVRLYNLQKVLDLDSLFYGQLIGQQQSTNILPMPPIKSMALSKEERTMNIFLEKGETICFDTNIIKVKKKLEDFGLS